MSPIEGIDISHHQAVTPSLDGLGFVFVRATYGTQPDDRYAQHAAAVRRAGKVLGAYHFGRFGSGRDQAAAFLDVIGPVQLVALDFEVDRDNPHMTEGQAREFMDAVRATGRRIGLYASRSGYPDLGQDFRWIAAWGDTAPRRPWAFWQYQGSPLDRDRFSGTADQLGALAGYTRWRAVVPAGTSVPLFTVADGVVTHMHRRHDTHGISRRCRKPEKVAWPGHRDQLLVKLAAGPHVPARFAHREP